MGTYVLQKALREDPTILLIFLSHSWASEGIDASEHVRHHSVEGLRKIHWSAPASMIGALIAGVASAIAHHLFYRSLAGTNVAERDVLDSGISRQQLNLAIGTTFATWFGSSFAH